VSTGVALATASYPTGMEPLAWTKGLVTIGGSNYDVTEFSVTCNNNLDVDRRFIRNNTDKKEPTGGKREVEFSLSADFDSLTQRNRAHASTRAAALAAITATWEGPTLLGSTLYPSLQVSIPASRFDSWAGAMADDAGIKQELSGVGTYDGTNSPVTITYKSADSTA
ncbi:MAG TPA: phage tail tube protein, partial [Aeromicrobium sp.]